MDAQPPNARRSLAGSGPARAAARGAGAVLGAASSLLGRLRRAKPLHPSGTVLQGRLTRSGSARSGVPWIDTGADEDVVVRLSRGGGLPAWAPDVEGLAVRHQGEGPPVDLLLATTGWRPVSRHLLTFHRSAGRAGYTTLLPFRGPRGPILLAAQPLPQRRLPPDPVARGLLLAGQPLRLRLLWATPLGSWQRFGSLEVGGPVSARPDLPIRFDPESAPPGLGTYPWVTALRDPAYRAARRAVGPSSPQDGEEQLQDEKPGGG